MRAAIIARMAETFRIGIIGLQHDHLWWYLKGVSAAGRARITCAADPHPHLREKVGKAAGIAPDHLYDDQFDLLEKEELDACLVFVENARHAEVTESCARRGLHVMVEKPISSDLRGADRMLEAAAKHGVRLMVNYPTFHQPFAAECHRLVEKGVIGRLWMLRFAAGHGGPEEICTPEFLAWLLDPRRNGGGALQDFCTYGAALYAWFVGRPTRVSAQAGRFVKKQYKAEDHAVITVRSDDGTIGVIEGSWASRPGLGAFSLFGEKGAIFNDLENGLRFRIQRAGQARPAALVLPGTGGKWEDKVLPYFVRRIRDGQPFEGMTDPSVARTAQEILDAAKRSIASGREIRLGR
jgi:predicted dehydrogenase